MKKLHLLCNSHIDPVWLWRRNEGLAETLSTFRVAADFCEQYDGFIFNHNESLLYEWIEEHDPQLFLRIQKLVKEGKWHIMGGWYLQPDCVMTSGESLLSQISLGKQYFKEKFNAEPTTATNFDPFGHTRGLVQILTRCGYDSYIYARPFEFEGELLWEGFDGSRVLGHGLYGGYGALKGEALNKVKGYLSKYQEKETGLCLWGVGNHGGGPSRIDLENLNAFADQETMEIIHSTAETYMAEIDRSQLNVHTKALAPCMVGCYTTMVRIKQANRRLENKIALAEKAMSYATLQTGAAFDAGRLTEAKKALAFCQFHDILPGSAVKVVEEDSLRTFHYGEEIADRLYEKAFFQLCSGQEKAEEGTIPVLLFNPHPYEIEGEWELEFLLQNQNYTDDETTLATVYDEAGNILPTQNETPQSTLSLDWVKRISFRGKAAPSGVTRFNCKLHKVRISQQPVPAYPADCIEVDNGRITARISKKTGLIETYTVNGTQLIQNSGRLEVYRDDEDSYGSEVSSFLDFEDSFTLMSDEEANRFLGYPEEPISNVRVIEDGAVRTKIQAFFSYGRSVAVVEYTLPKADAYIDVNIRMYAADPLKMFRYALDTKLTGTPYGETAFGYDELFDDGRESVYHKWCGIDAGDQKISIVNNGIYGGSFTKNSLRLSLLRTSAYACLPVKDRPLAPHDRFIDHVDFGERTFSFRITAVQNIEREAYIYNEAPQLLSFFPSGEGEKISSAITLDNPEVFLSSIRAKGDGYELTLFNATAQEQDAEVNIPALNRKMQLHFGKCELKILEI